MRFGLRGRFHSHQAVWWTLAAGLTATTGLGWQMHHEAVAMDKQRLAMRVAEVTAQLNARLERTEMLLENLKDYLMWSGENRDQVFERWCQENGLTINCPWLHGIAVATNRNEPQWRDQLQKPLETWTTNEWAEFDGLVRHQLVEWDIALTSEVVEGKRFLPDYYLQRMFWDEDALSHTIRESRLAMSEHRTVMLGTNGDELKGTLFYVPLYQPEVADLLTTEGLTQRQTTSVRWMYVTSLIVAPLDFNELARSVWDGTPSDLGMEFFSSTNQTVDTWLNTSEGLPRAGDPQFRACLTYRQPWPMYGQMFSIFFYTTPLFEAQSPRRLAKITIAAGTILTLLVTGLVSVTQRARNRQELMTEQIGEARDALTVAQRERNKISRDLHDGIIQSLYAIQLGLEHTIKKLEANPSKARSELSGVRVELDTVIAEIRQFIKAEVDAEKPVDFCAVLQSLAKRVQAGTTAQIALRCEPGGAARLNAAQAVQLANITREALSNSLRHGKPQRVQIVLRSDRHAVVLEISDDGTGFDPSSPGRSGVGLASMSSRAQEAGGALELQSSPGEGTQVEVRLPVCLPEALGENCPPTSTDES